MAYRMTSLRIRCYCYDPMSPGNTDLTAFKAESRRLFQDLGWTLHEGEDGISDTVMKDRQDLYLHPEQFSSVLDESNIAILQEQLAVAQTFHCYAVDCYEEYQDMSNEEYRAVRESKRDEIVAFTLKQYQTKHTNLYIVDSVAEHIAEHFEICRLCDRDRWNSVGRRFVLELIDHLLREGRLVTAEANSGRGIRAATAKELQARSQPGEQIEGQITMIFSIHRAIS